MTDVEIMAPSKGRRRFVELASIAIAFSTMIAAIAVPWYLYTIGQQRAILTLRYLANQSLVNVSSNTTNVKVTVDGAEVHSPRLISVKLEDTGNTSIQSQEIRDPLSITFTTANVLKATVTDISPKELASSVINNGKSVTIKFDLLNPGDYIVLSILVDGNNTDTQRHFVW